MLYEDRVELTLAGDTLAITESYEVRAGIVNQPAGFGLRLGHGGVLRELLASYPPNTPFALTVNGNQVQSGNTDGFAAGEATGAGQITFEGRDALALLVDSYVAAEKSFSGLTYRDLVIDVFKEIGITIQPTGGDQHPQLFSSNEANRRRMAGKEIVQVTPPAVTKDEFTIDNDIEVTLFRDPVAGTSKSIYKTVKIQIGTKWYEWLKQQLDRAGLFLWATATGDFILSAPNAAQDPAYRIIKQRRGERGVGNVVRYQYRNNIVQRYTKTVVYGRGGGRSVGRGKVRGEFVDQEMVDILGGEDRKVRTWHDHNVKTIKQAEHMARRMTAEANRDAWQLIYTVAGHSTQTQNGRRAVWVPDTVVEVDDRELGIAGNFYLETVTMNRQPDTTTTLRLMRPQDLVFATEDEEP